jgi:hypothetical protein
MLIRRGGVRHAARCMGVTAAQVGAFARLEELPLDVVVRVQMRMLDSAERVLLEREQRGHLDGVEVAIDPAAHRFGLEGMGAP